MIALLALAAADPLPMQAMHNFGACVVSYTPKGAREVLALDYRTPEYQRRLRRLLKGHERCAVGSSIGSSSLMFAGSLAEAMLKAEVRPADLSQRLVLEPGQGKIEARSPMEAMALCTVIAAPRLTIALFTTEPGTPEEKAAFAPLAPVLTNCLQENMKLTVNRPGLRSLLSLAAWRIASTPRKAAQ